MERIEQNPVYEFDLHTLRNLCDSKAVGSTKATRTTKILTYLFEVSQGSVTPEDPLHSLEDYLPSLDELPSWIDRNLDSIEKLNHQDPRDYMTDRYDLDEYTAQFSESAWLRTSYETRRILSLNPDIERANVALRLLYLEAYTNRNDVISDLTRASDHQTGSSVA